MAVKRLGAPMPTFILPVPDGEISAADRAALAVGWPLAGAIPPLPTPTPSVPWVALPGRIPSPRILVSRARAMFPTWRAFCPAQIAAPMPAVAAWPTLRGKAYAAFFITPTVIMEFRLQVNPTDELESQWGIGAISVRPNGQEAAITERAINALRLIGVL